MNCKILTDDAGHDAMTFNMGIRVKLFTMAPITINRICAVFLNERHTFHKINRTEEKKFAIYLWNLTPRLNYNDIKLLYFIEKNVV